jgi:MFS family permease
MGRGYVFYGWRIVGVGALAQAISVGATFYAYGALLKPVAAEFEASRLAVTLGLTLLTLVQGVVAPFLGRAIDAGWVRGVLIVGVVIQACGMLLLARATAFWQVGLLFATAVSVGSTCFGPLATASLVANWFMRGRGRALGLTALGAALGGGVFPPLVTWLIAELGWRGAVAAMGVGVLVLVAPFAWIVVARPEEIGSAPDGELLAEGAASSEAGELAAAPSTAELVRTRNFWAISMAIGLAFCPVSVLLAHLVPYITDLGHSPARAALVMSVYAFSSGIGRVVFGSLADRVDKRIAAWISFGCLTIAWSGLLGGPPFAVLIVAAAGSGLGMGGIAPLWGALTGAAFGRASFGRVMGLMNLLMLPFSMLGAPAAAHLFDRTGSYQLAFSLFLAFFVLAACSLGLLRLPESEPGTEGQGA